MAAPPDSDTEQLRERVAFLKKQLAVRTSTLLAAESTKRLLSQRPASKRETAADKRARTRLLDLCDALAAHKQQCLYRTGASVTSFRVRDPDPRAVDEGRVLGLRLDVMMGAQFLRPYYVLLHREGGGQQKRQQEQRLRVHRHTVPPCIPLAALAARYLGESCGRHTESTESTDKTDENTGASDVYGFARALRRALVRYHNRLAVIGDLRRALQARATKAAQGDTDGREEREEREGMAMLTNIGGADAEAKQIRLDWVDGRTGRLVLDDDGNIEQLVVMGVDGIRDRAAARALLAGETTAAGLVKRLSGG